MKRGNVLLLAMLCHEANRAYCISQGDQSQPTWDALPYHMQQSVVDGVQHALGGADPYSQHERWCAVRSEQGWVYGEVKDTEAKTHPNLVSYDLLPPANREKTRLFLDLVKTMQKYLE